MFGRIDDIN